MIVIAVPKNPFNNASKNQCKESKQCKEEVVQRDRIIEFCAALFFIGLPVALLVTLICGVVLHFIGLQAQSELPSFYHDCNCQARILSYDSAQTSVWCPQPQINTKFITHDSRRKYCHWLSSDKLWCAQPVTRIDDSGELYYPSNNMTCYLLKEESASDPFVLKYNLPPLRFEGDNFDVISHSKTLMLVGGVGFGFVIFIFVCLNE